MHTTITATFSHREGYQMRVPVELNDLYIYFHGNEKLDVTDPDNYFVGTVIDYFQADYVGKFGLRTYEHMLDVFSSRKIITKAE